MRHTSSSCSYSARSHASTDQLLSLQSTLLEGRGPMHGWRLPSRSYTLARGFCQRFPLDRGTDRGAYLARGITGGSDRAQTFAPRVLAPVLLLHRRRPLLPVPVNLRSVLHRAYRHNLCVRSFAGTFSRATTTPSLAFGLPLWRLLPRCIRAWLSPLDRRPVFITSPLATRSPPFVTCAALARRRRAGGCWVLISSRRNRPLIAPAPSPRRLCTPHLCALFVLRPAELQR